MKKAEDYVYENLNGVSNEEIYFCVESYADEFALKFIEFFSSNIDNRIEGFDFEEMLNRFKDSI